MIPKADLAAAVTEAHKLGRLTDRLSRLALQIATGYLASDKFAGYSHADKQDVTGMFCIRLVQTWHRLDPTQNCHAYLTRAANLAWKDFERSNSRRLRREMIGAEIILQQQEAEMLAIMRKVRGVNTTDDEH